VDKNTQTGQMSRARSSINSFLASGIVTVVVDRATNCIFSCVQVQDLFGPGIYEIYDVFD
jgi:hypothetical protein